MHLFTALSHSTYFPFSANFLHVQDSDRTLLESELPAADAVDAAHGERADEGPDMSKCMSFKSLDM